MRSCIKFYCKLVNTILCFLDEGVDEPWIPWFLQVAWQVAIQVCFKDWLFLSKDISDSVSNGFGGFARALGLLILSLACNNWFCDETSWIDMCDDGNELNWLPRWDCWWIVKTDGSFEYCLVYDASVNSNWSFQSCTNHESTIWSTYGTHKSIQTYHIKYLSADEDKLLCSTFSWKKLTINLVTGTHTQIFLSQPVTNFYGQS